MSKRSELRVGVLSDIHVPFHDKKATKMALDYLENAGLDKLVLLGDIADFIAVSRYGKSLRRRASLVDEIDQTISFLDEVKARFPKTELIYTKGNHEDRWDRYITDHAPEFGELDILRLSIFSLMQILSKKSEFFVV